MRSQVYIEYVPVSWVPGMEGAGMVQAVPSKFGPAELPQ